MMWTPSLEAACPICGLPLLGNPSFYWAEMDFLYISDSPNIVHRPSVKNHLGCLVMMHIAEPHLGPTKSESLWVGLGNRPCYQMLQVILNHKTSSRTSAEDYAHRPSLASRWHDHLVKTRDSRVSDLLAFKLNSFLASVSSHAHSCGYFLSCSLC